MEGYQMWPFTQFSTLWTLNNISKIFDLGERETSLFSLRLGERVSSNS